MIKKATLPRLIAVLFTGLLCGCSAQTQQTPQTEYDKANMYITQGNYNEAIALMQTRLEGNLADDEARLLLASAFAARAGIFMSQYFDIGEQIVQKVRSSEQYLNTLAINTFNRMEKSAKTDKQRDTIEVFQAVNKVLFQVNQLIEIFKLIPKLSEQNKRDLAAAVNILSSQNNWTNGPLIYRGMLHLILLKNEMGTKYRNLGYENCRLNLLVLAQQISGLQNELSQIMRDLFAGSSSKKKKQDLFVVNGVLNNDLASAIQILNQYSGYTSIDITEVSARVGKKCSKQ